MGTPALPVCLYQMHRGTLLSFEKPRCTYILSTAGFVTAQRQIAAAIVYRLANHGSEQATAPDAYVDYIDSGAFQSTSSNVSAQGEILADRGGWSEPCGCWDTHLLMQHVQTAIPSDPISMRLSPFEKLRCTCIVAIITIDRSDSGIFHTPIYIYETVC